MTRDEILKQFNIPLPGEGLLKAAEKLRSQCLPVDFNASIRAIENFNQQFGIIDKNLFRDIIEAHKRMMSMLNDPQFQKLQKLEKVIQGWSREVPSPCKHDPLPEPGELCAAVDALAEKAGLQGVEEDALPDEKTLQDLFFFVAFYAAILTPAAINDWIQRLHDILKIQIHEAVNAAGGVFVSGVLNIYTLLVLSLYLASHLK